jgi:CheY-like chemotaxis protein
VLIVEDNLVNQKVAAAMVKRLGMTCKIASSGQEAVDLYRANHFALVLMDCQMPGLDGFATTRAIRALPGRQCPILALTAAASNADRQSALQAGMDDFLSKPVDRKELAKKLRFWLKQAEIRAAP